MSDSPQVDPLTRRSEWSNWIILIVLALAMFFIFHFRPFGHRDATSHRAVGQKLPSLMLMPLTGDSQPTALRNLSGQVVLVNFWGTWCPPCRSELPHIAAIEEKYRGLGGFQLLAVSCGRGERENVPELRDETAAMLKNMKIDMPTYTDPDGASRAAYDSVAGFDGYPTTFLLDGQGVIRGVWSGFRPGIEQEMEELISQLLAKRG